MLATYEHTSVQRSSARCNLVLPYSGTPVRTCSGRSGRSRAAIAAETSAAWHPAPSRCQSGPRLSRDRRNPREVIDCGNAGVVSGRGGDLAEQAIGEEAAFALRVTERQNMMSCAQKHRLGVGNSGAPRWTVHQHCRVELVRGTGASGEGRRKVCHHSFHNLVQRVVPCQGPNNLMPA